jgi:hypothetical protein
MISAIYKLVIILSNILEFYRFSILFSTVYYIPQLYRSIQKNEPMYIAHHAISGGLSTAALFQPNLRMYKIYFDFMTIMDISGLFVDIYKIIPATVYNRKALCVGYIPIRCVVAPYMLISNPPFDTKTLITASGYWCLIFGSYIWSFKLLSFEKFKN